MRKTKRLGRYHLTYRIAFGGMAELFRAFTFDEHAHQQSVAIKRLLPHFREDRQFLDMLTDEFKLVSYLKHPNIAEVYELQLQDLAAQYEDAWEAAQGGPGPGSLGDAVCAHIAGNAAMHQRLLRIDETFYRAYQRDFDLGERYSERFDRTFLEQAERWLRDQLELHRDEVVVDDLDMAAFSVARSVAGALRSAARDQPSRLADPAFMDALERMALLYLEGSA